MTEFASAPLTAASNAGVVTGTFQANCAPIKQPMRGLFDVEVDGLLGFSLIPLNDLARDLAHAWVAGETKIVLHGRTQYAVSKRLRVTKLAITKVPDALLTDGGDPFYTGRRISAEERTIALAAIEAHREAKRAKSAPKKRSRR